MLFVGSLLFAGMESAQASFNYTGDQTNQESRFEQRRQYKKLLAYLQTNQFSKFNREKSSLENYPLYPYLEYQYLIRRMSRQRPEDILAFTTQYADTPLANQLLTNWFYSLGKRGQWQTLVAHYSNDQGATKENRCLHAYGLHRVGKTEEAMARAQALWLVPFSQPDECDSIFKLWRDQGSLTDELAWQRYEAAIIENEITLANYLERYLATNDRPDATKLKRFHVRPRRLASESLPDLRDERGLRIFNNGLHRLTRRDVDLALKVLEKNVNRLQEQGASLDQFYTDIAIRLVRDNKDLAPLENFPIDLTANQALVEAQIRRQLRDRNWGTALTMLNLVDESDSARWKYWRARILLELGTLEGASESQSIFNEIATERDFYGFLAADRLGKAYNFEDTPESITHEQVHALEETPGIQRALELFTLEESTRARREWNFTTQKFSDVELRIAARVAEKWGWHEQAIRAMIKARAWDDLQPRFPLAYRDNFVLGSRKEDIPVTWSLAIARQESAFMADARSSAGALGLMQLMPATAQQVARETNRRLRSNQELTDPTINIELGTAYLGRMFRRFSHNRVLASAAYNAGPSRVDRWIDASLPVDIWIETIPFQETRNYVQNVLMFSTIYSRKLGQQSPMIYQHELLDFAPLPLQPSSTAQNQATPAI
jgi:soluble lytic murein transglycosylase